LSRLTGLTPPAGTVGPDFGPKISTAIGKTVRDAGVSPTEGGVVDGPSIQESDRSAIQTAVNAYVYDPVYGRTLNPFVVTLNGGVPIVWTNMPTALTGATGTQTKIPMHTSGLARLTADVLVAGSTNAVLIAQVSLDGSAWTSGPQVSISTTGLKVSTLTVIPTQFQTDCFFRIAGSGGNATADPSFGLVTVQFG
jgi:hypothetical protein